MIIVSFLMHVIQAGLFKSRLLPLPTPGKGEKVVPGSLPGFLAPHPAKGRQPLGSLLCSAFK